MAIDKLMPDLEGLAKQTFYSLFKEVALKQPMSPALVTPDGASITYAKLLSKINKLAAGLPRNQIVGIYLERSIAFEAVKLACSQSGCFAELSTQWACDSKASYSRYTRERALL